MADGSTGGRPKSLSHIKYRSDIDGLRAVAVLLVLAAHFKTHVSGGYIGVDVFFVISGYLISATILKEMANGTFSVATFYERRLRRIFPALIVMLLATSALAYRYLFPTELADYARSLFAAMFSVSNFWFWHQAGYFSAPSAFKPLLHTWSLAVEEQFYIFFPIFLVAVRRFARHQLRNAILLVAGLTFVCAVVYTRRDASEAFFFAPLRAWELLVGTIVSQKYFPALRSAAARNAAALTGLLLILVPALRYTPETPFPGFAALAPCLGAALIIAAGETGTSVVGDLLSLRPVVWVGLISYSLYLWHWPVLVFQEIAHMIAPLPAMDRRLKVAMFAISIALGWASWRFVETPFRKGRLRPKTRSLFIVNGIGVAAVTAIGAVFLATNGAPQRFPQDALQVAQYLDYDRRGPFREGSCFLDSDQSFADFKPSECMPVAAGRRNVLILGDSQAAQLWFGLNDRFPEVNFMQATAFACPPFAAKRGTEPPPCRRLADYIHNDFLVRQHIDAVILGGRWLEQDVPALQGEIRWMKDHGIPVFLVGPMVEYDQPFPRLLASSLRDHAPQEIAGHEMADQRRLDVELARLAGQDWGVDYISYFQELCTPQCAHYAAPGIPLLFDEHHLTAAGSSLFAGRVRERGELRALLAAPERR